MNKIFFKQTLLVLGITFFTFPPIYASLIDKTGKSINTNKDATIITKANVTKNTNHAPKPTNRHIASTFSGHPLPPEIHSIKWLTDEEYAAAQKEALKRASRKVASSENIGKDPLKGTPFGNFRDDYLNLKTTDELDLLLNRINSVYLQSEGRGTAQPNDWQRYTQNNKMPLDLKFVAAQMIPLRSLRGFVFKLIPLVSKRKLPHSILLTGVQQVAAFLRTYIPTERWEIGFDYVTQPYESKDTRFYTDLELQAYIADQVYPQWLECANRLANLATEFKNSSIFWDNQILYGENTFDDYTERFRILTEADYYAAQATAQLNLSGMAFFLAYNVDGFLQMYSDLGMLYGIDGFVYGVNGARALDRYKIIHQTKFSHTFTLHKNGQEWTSKCTYPHLREAVRYANLFWLEVKDRTTISNDSFLVEIINPFNRQWNLSFDNIAKMVEGRWPIRSTVTGDIIHVDIPNFFKNPPQDLKNLSPLSPQQGGFDTAGPEMLPFKINGQQIVWPKKEPTLLGYVIGNVAEKVKYRNYYYGRAKKWDVEEYKRLFPELKNGEDVQRHARILFQSWGGWFVGMPLGAFFML